MLSFLRKHTGLIMFVLAFVFVGLAFFGDTSSLRMPGSGNVVMSTKNNSFGEKEYALLGSNSHNVCYSSTRHENPEDPDKPFYTYDFPELVQFAAFLSEEDNNTIGGLQKFFANRIILRDEAQKHGLVPSREQVEAKIHSFDKFMNANGQFSPERYRDFTKKLGGYRMTEGDFLDLVKDLLSLDRLSSLVMSGIAMDSDFLSTEFNSIQATQSVKTATLSLEQFNVEENVDEAVLQEYWKPFETRYMSDELRSATVYIMVPKEKITPETDSAEEGEPKHAIHSTSQKIAVVAEGIWEEVVNKKKGEEFDITIQGASANHDSLYSLKKETFDMFSLKNLPETLQKSFNPAAGQTGTLGTAIFGIAPGGSAADNTSDVLILEDGSVALFQLNGIKASEPLKFEEAKTAVLADYTKDKSTEQLDLAAEALRQKLSDGIAAGESFEEIAKEAKAETASIEKLTRESGELGIFMAARLINPKQITRIIKEDDKRILAELISRSLEDTPEVATTRMMFKARENNGARRMAIYDWFRSQYEAREVKFASNTER